MSCSYRSFTVHNLELLVFSLSSLAFECIGNKCSIKLNNNPISNGNRTESSQIWSVIIRVINKIVRPRSRSPICLITSMITDRIGRHEVLLPINHNLNKIFEKRLFFKTRNSNFFASSEKKSHLRARVMARTVLLNCPIRAEIRRVDSKSDLRILL